MSSRVYERGAAAEIIYRAFGIDEERRSRCLVEVRRNEDRLSVTAFHAGGYSELVSTHDGSLTLKSAASGEGTYVMTTVAADGSVRRSAQAYQPFLRSGSLDPIPLSESQGRELRAEVVEVAGQILPAVSHRGVSSFRDYLAGIKKRSLAPPI